MAKITATFYEETDREEETDAVCISFPPGVGERLYEQLLDDYMYLSEAETHDLAMELMRVLKEAHL